MFKCREFDENRGKPGRIEMPDGGWEEIETDHDDPEWAAEVFAKDLVNRNSCDIGPTFAVEVLHPNGKIDCFDVMVEWEPEVYLTERETIPTPEAKP